jgi:hypothetical protein
MNDITYEEVKKFLIETEFDFVPSQKEISFPIIQRIHRRLQQGNTFSDIKVKKNVIVDGHHRYISHKLLAVESGTTVGGSISDSIEYIWSEIDLTSVDYDSESDRKMFEERYDIQ